MISAAVVLIVALIAALLLGMPIIWALTLSSVLSVLVDPGLSFAVIAQRIFAGADSFALLAVPGFMLAGDIMSKGGLSKRLVEFANGFFGWVSGGISIVALISCTFFAAISGSSVATTAAIGGLMYPEMVKRGYPEDYSAAIQAIGGTLGIVIPPSIIFVVYGNVTGVSIAGLLMSGVIPGVLCGIMLCVYAWYVARRNHWPKENCFSLRNALYATKNAFFALLMPLIILGGIYTGLFTPTESAIVAVFYGAIVCLVGYREITFRDLWEIVKNTSKTTANLMVLVITAQVFGYLVTYYNIPVYVANWFMGFCSSRALFLFTSIILLTIAGMFMDVSAIILILGPILAPLAVSYGVDPIHFGLIVVFILAMGQATPPFGTCLFVACGLSKRPFSGVGKRVLPFVFVEVACGFLFAYIPPLATFLPNLIK